MIYPEKQLAIGRLNKHDRFIPETVSTYHVGRDHDGNITILATVIASTGGERGEALHTFDPETPLREVLDALADSNNPVLKALAPLDTPRIDRFIAQPGDLHKVDPENDPGGETGKTP